MTLHPTTGRLISLTISNGALLLLILGACLLLINFVELPVGGAVSPNNIVLITLLVSTATVVLNPLQMRLQRLMERRLFGDRIDYLQELEDHSDNLRHLFSQSEIYMALTKRIETGVHPDRLMFFVYDEFAAQFVQKADGMGSSEGIRFSPADGLARLLVEQIQIVYLAPGEPLPGLLAQEADQLDVVGASLYIPLPQHGWVALGGKRSGEPYTPHDFEYLEALADQAALALDRVQLISDLERRVNELNALRWISQAIHFTVGLDDLFELIYNQTSRVLGIDNFDITLYDEDRGTLSSAFHVEDGERHESTAEWTIDTGGLLAEIIHSGQPILTDASVGGSQRHSAPLGVRADRAWMGVPLNAGDRVIGVMSVSNLEPVAGYGQDQLGIFSAIADQAASIIYRASLDEEMQERTRQLTVLNEVGSVVNSSLDMQTVLEIITQKAAEILEAESGSLWLIDADSGELVFQAAVGPTAAALVGLRLPAGTGIAGATAGAQETVIVNDAPADKRWYAGADESSGFESRAILSVPLVHKGSSIGVLQVLNKSDGSPFGDSDAQLMQSFASHAAVALENARLFTLTDQALADRVAELSMFQWIDRTLNATLDYKNVIELTLDWAVQATAAVMGSVTTLDEERGELLLVASQGYPLELERFWDRPWPVSEGILGRAVRTGEPVVVDDVSTDPDYVDIVPDTRAQLVVPLRLSDRVIGAVSLESPKASGFSREDVQFATRLAERAVVPIQNAQLYEQVRQANDAKSQFVSMVAHELKVPMTSIKGYARLLEITDGPIDETKKGFIRTINANVDRMTKAVNDLLDISRIETGRLKLEMDTVSVSVLIDETLASLRGAIEGKGLILNVCVPEDLPLVWGDRARLLQIMINLVSNAAKYTVEGSIDVCADVVQMPDSDGGSVAHYVRFSVRDTGIGISLEDQDRLFKSQFVRFENAVEIAPGHGLGLWLVNRLAQLQGSEIKVESELGKGSAFSFIIPAAVEQIWSPAHAG